MEHTILSLVLFGSFFLGLITLLHSVCSKISFPYTVALLLTGFLGQFLVHIFHIDTHLELNPNIIFFILLPILLFEGAIHINLHQFRLQFKTISSLATFGLLVSVFVVGVGIAVLTGMPFGPALLFGALISATDPIAVLALFKSLGAPKRLSLVADGESMLNDATGVIAFRIVSAFVITGVGFEITKVVEGFGSFLYVFIGSFIYGSLLGYFASKIITLFRNDGILVNGVTAALVIGSFVTAEHYFHLSGVITTVMAAIILGNIGRNNIPEETTHFIKEFWAFLGFVSVSLVFFFASFNLNIQVFFGDIKNIVLAIIVVLLARAVSVYLTSYISNKSAFFKDEPNIPMSWQHILNWGGLRGVIPLVLVYSLPDAFAYKEQILGFTLATLVFTLIINGLTIKWLLKTLKLHLPRKEEQIIQSEMAIFEIENLKNRLDALLEREFDPNLLKDAKTQLNQKEQLLKDLLLSGAEPTEFSHSLKIQSIEIERETLEKLLHQGRISENPYYFFLSELDLQEDALEYPEVYKDRIIMKGGFIDTSNSYRKRLLKLQKVVRQFPILKSIFNLKENDIVKERYEMLQARILTSYAVLDYIQSIEKIFTKVEFKKAIKDVELMQKRYIDKNLKEIAQISKKYKEIAEGYQKTTIQSLIQAV